jgi:alcohol dehydrogenase (quinone), cytochrome c subunit
MLTTSERVKKLPLWAIPGLIVAIVVAIAVNRTPISPLASVPVGMSHTPIADAEYVARLGDCVACHSVPDGQPFAGGLKMGTPLGIIYATNITPDKETGIGNYTLAEFDNAVRRGVARDGRRLYPAMPYPSYAKMSDSDLKALYDYFMRGVQPVHQPNQKDELKWPFNLRWPLAFWNAVFLDDQPYRAKPAFDAAWNRGAYLVQGLGHCGSCHTPRGAAMQEKALDEGRGLYLSGAALDGWKASSLRGDLSTGLGRWSEQDIVEFLKTGRNIHATVYGSMMDAFNDSTQFMSDADLAAIARYLKTLAGRQGTERRFVAQESTTTALNAGDFGAAGSGLYLKQCGFCHGLDGRGHGQLLPPLAGNPTVIDDDPSSVINIVLNGAGRIVTGGVPDSYRMPPFRVLLSDRDVSDLANFVRRSWGNEASAVSIEAVKSLRGSTDSTSDHVVILRMR